ncbi:MAG TPA: dihydrofolate reductase family protein [Acidobacteriaceae bacterium]
MPCSVFVGISVDGFLARPDGSVDFLDVGGNTPHGFEEFYASIDAIVIGRKTFEWVLSYCQSHEAWPYGKKRVVALSSRPLDFSSLAKASIEQMSGEPADIVARLSASGAQHLYIDGGLTIQRFLLAGQLDRLIVTCVPVLIGQGVPLFGALPADVSLRHVATRTWDTGLVQTEYHIVKPSSCVR